MTDHNLPQFTMKTNQALLCCGLWASSSHKQHRAISVRPFYTTLHQGYPGAIQLRLPEANVCRGKCVCEGGGEIRKNVW